MAFFDDENEFESNYIIDKITKLLDNRNGKTYCSAHIEEYDDTTYNVKLYFKSKTSNLYIDIINILQKNNIMYKELKEGYNFHNNLFCINFYRN